MPAVTFAVMTFAVMAFRIQKSDPQQDNTDLSWMKDPKSIQKWGTVGGTGKTGRGKKFGDEVKFFLSLKGDTVEVENYEKEKYKGNNVEKITYKVQFPKTSQVDRYSVEYLRKKIQDIGKTKSRTGDPGRLYLSASVQVKVSEGFYRLQICKDPDGKFAYNFCH